jgi:hypothetical protein
MAIRAQKHTLASLRAKPFKRQRDPLRIDFDPLLSRPHVMKMQGAHVLAVATDAADSTSLGNEDRLHLAASS